MDDKTRSIVRRPEVLRKLNAENLLMIERGLLGDLPDRLKPPPPVPVRGRPADLTIAKHSSFLSACLPVAPDSPFSEKPLSSDDEGVSPSLKKSFSFRGKFTRISFLGKKDKSKTQCKPIEERKLEKVTEKHERVIEGKYGTKTEQDFKASKRFWFFRNKEIERREKHVPIYKRSKSFEFLPRALEEENEGQLDKQTLKSSRSFIYGSNDTMGEAWGSNESLQFVSPVIKHIQGHGDPVFSLESIKESVSGHNSSISTATSTNSSGIINIFKRESVQDLLDEFDRTVELFGENYQSDCEPYTKTELELEEMRKEKRKSRSFATLPSPKIVKINPLKASDISEDFKRELSNVLSAKRESASLRDKTARRGSVTDWFVLEEKAMPDDKFRRALKKPTNRVRRMSSTKYWITPEECAVYSREQRPPLVIPRITQYRGQRETPSFHQQLQEHFESKSLSKQCDLYHDSSPTSDGYEMDRYSEASSDSPRALRPITRNRRVGSTENLLFHRPNFHLHMPASSSGDSLDVELRGKDPGSLRRRKSRSMVAPKQRIKSPVPTPRTLLPRNEIGMAQPKVVHEGQVKRTKFAENGKKCKKNWSECYLILTTTALTFYKDQRSYVASQSQKTKKPGAPPSPTSYGAELVLPLSKAIVHQCIQMHTRRYTRSLVVILGNDQYLIQDETEDRARHWLKLIQHIIYRCTPLAEFEHIPPELESPGVTPPASRLQLYKDRGQKSAKQKAGGSSNEDLSDSTEASIQKNHVKSRLKKFFAKRPAMEQLVKKGIYKDEPVFGRNLDEVCPQTSPRVPEFVKACVSEIEKSEENMCTDGLYRASGNLSQVQKIRLEIDQNNSSVIQNSPDIHVLTGSLKLFFRELKEPLIPHNLFDRALSACSIKPREARTREFKNIVDSLPPCNRDTLKYLLEHLLRVTQYSERNRMHTANLAIVFGPTLLWAPPSQAHNMAVDCMQQNNVVDILLTDFEEIFAEDVGKTKRKA